MLLQDMLVPGTGAERADVAADDSLQRLLCAAPATRYAEAARLVRAGAVRVDDQALVIVATPIASMIDDVGRVEAGVAVHRYAQNIGGRGVLHAVRDRYVVVLVASPDGAELERRAAALGTGLHRELAAGWGGRHRASVGVGEVASSLAAAAQSYQEARWAACVAGRVQESGPLARWRDLGVYQLFRGIDERGADVLPAAVKVLLDCPNAEMLLDTLEVYLDTGGDAQATAARLHLARGSLYYRLRRIEESAGVDLSDGRERLTLHLGLKLAKLTGEWAGVRYGLLDSLAA